MYNVEVGHKRFEEIFEVFIFEDEELLALLNYIRSQDDLELVSVHGFNSIHGLEEFKNVLKEMEENIDSDLEENDWYMIYKEALKYFSENYQSHVKLSFCLLGGGISLTDLLEVPGNSRIVNQIYIPYDINSLHSNYKKSLNKNNMCSAQNTILYNNIFNQLIEVGVDNKNIIVNCALTTDRYRKGDNRAFIFIENVGVWKVILNKLSEETFKLSKDFISNKRIEEDQTISQIVLSLILNKPQLLPTLKDYNTTSYRFIQVDEGVL